MPQILFSAPSDEQAQLRKIVDTQRQTSRARRIVSPALAFQAASLAAAYPNMDSGQVVGLALGGEQPGSPTAEMVSERQLLQTQTSEINKPSEEEGWFDNFVYDPFKGLIRGAFTVLNAGIEEAESLIVRGGIGAAQGVRDPLAMAGRSDAFYALSAAMSGEAVNLGEGFMPDSTISQDVQEKLAQGMSLADAMAGSMEQQKLGTPITVEGQMDRERMKLTHSSGKQVPISLGRAVAINFTEPGTRSFQYLSGMTDAMKQIVLDPADLALGGLGKARKLSKLVGNADEASALSRAARSALLGDSRKTFFQTNWDDYLASNQGAKFTQRINDAVDDDGYREIYDLYRGTQKTVDPADITALTNSTDLTQTANLIRDLGSKQGAPFRKFGRVGWGAEASTVSRGAGGTSGLLGGALRNPVTSTVGKGARPLPAMGLAAAFGGAEAFAQGVGGLGATALGMKPSNLTKAIQTMDIPMRQLIGDAYETGLGFSIRQGSTGTYLGRLAASTSAKSLNVNDAVQATEELNQYLRGLGIADADYNRLMRKAGDPMGEWTKAIDAGKSTEAGLEGMFGHYFGILKEANEIWADGVRASGGNISEEALTGIGNMFDSHDAMRAYWKNNAGEDMLFGNARVTYLDGSGEAKAMPSALLFSQFMEQNIPLMDSRKVRSLQRRAWWSDKTKGDKLNKIFGADDFERVGHNAMIGAADFAIGKLWKPSVLLRMAWPVRVIGEEQFRLSGAMLSGSFNHPIQFISLMMARDNRLLGKFARMDNDALGRAFMDAAEHDAAMSKSLAGMTGGNKASRWEARTKTELGQRGSAEAHINSVNQMRNDELTVAIAGRLHDEFLETGGVTGNSLQEIKNRWWDGDLEYMRRNMVNDSKRMEIMNIRADADAYIDDVYAHLVHQSGGRGRMLNRHTNEWRDFDGNVTPASEMTGNRQMVSAERMEASDDVMALSDEAFAALEMNEPPQQIAEGIADQLDVMLREVNPNVDGEFAIDMVQELEEKLYKILGAEGAEVNWARTQEALDSTIRETAEKLGIGETKTSLRAQGRVATGDTELIPSQEVMEGAPVQGTGNFRRTHQGETLGQKVGEPGSGLDLAKNDMVDNMGTVEVEELKNIARGEHRTYTLENPDGMYTLTFGEGGIPLAGLSWSKYDGKIQVHFMTGVDNQGFAALMDDMATQGNITKAEILDSYVGNQRFIDYIRESAESGPVPLPDNIKNYDQLHAWIKKNPDSMKAIETNPNVAPFGGYADMSSSGTGMAKALGSPATRRTPEGAAYGAARETGQHRPYFEMEELGNPKMLELIATGRIGADDFAWGDNAVGSGTKAQFNTRTNYFDDEEWFSSMPEYLRKPMENASPEKVKVWDRAVGTLMNTLMSVPTNKLSRSPAFRQIYWQRMSQLYMHADDGIRDSLRITAGEAGLTDNIMQQLGKPFRALRRASGREVAMDEVLRRFDTPRTAGADVVWEAGTNPDAALREMDDIAKAYALQETKELLYDMSNDHNWSDMSRLAMPFGEAWYEVMSTWGKLIAENPRNLRRMQQAYQGAEDSNPFQGTGPDGEQGQGFFYRDPTTGEEVFNYPGSGIIANWMLGDAAEAVSLKGRVAGLSLMSQVMPGIGPIVQIPVSQMGWVDDPKNRVMRDFLLPFGKSKVDKKDPTSWLSPLLPAWVNKAVAGLAGEDSLGENKRLFMNTSMDVYKTLIMNGWSDSTEEEMQRTLAEAGRISQNMYKIKAFSSFVGPTAASELWEVKYDHDDTTGEVWAYQNLATAYREILDQHNGDDVAAYKKFTDLFGVDPMLFTTAKTQRVEPRAVTLEARRWEHDNEDLYNIDKFPATAYYARPDAIDGVFDYESYMLALRNGTRQPLTAEQWAMRRNQMLGKVAYANFQRSADLRFQDANVRQQWLRQQQASLMAYFPGFGRSIPGLPATHDLDTQIQELYRWKQEERLNESSVGESLGLYLTMRDNVVRRTMATYGYKTDTGWRSGKNAVMYRAQLRAYGQQLSQENPDFVPMYTQILLRELQEPEAGQAPVQLAGTSF